MMRQFWSSFVSTLLSVILLVQLIEPVLSGRSSGGGGGRVSSGGGFGGRSSSSGGGFGSSGSSSSRFGSSSPSGSSSSFGSGSTGGGSRFGSSSPSGSVGGTGGGSKFGSSSPAGAGASGSRMSSGTGAGASGAGAGSSRWGSSAPSGSSRPNYNAAGNSASRSAVNRPAANAPVPSQRNNIQPVYNTHTTVINNYGGGAFSRGGFGTGSLLLAGAGGMVGGYLLGSMVAHSLYSHNGCCYSCGCGYYGPPPPWYYDSYVPYRYRYQTETSVTTTTVAPVVAGGTTAAPKASKPTDVCTLARWNMELPFTEMPNMALTFLASDNISGEAIADKAKFFYQFLNSTAEPYGTLPATTNVFQIDPANNLRACNFNIPKLYATAAVSAGNSSTNTSANSTATERPFYAGALLEQWREMARNGNTAVCKMFSYASIPECLNQPSGPEEPFFTAIKRLTSLYTNASSDATLLSEIVSSAKKCYPKDITPPKEIIPCLDYSVDVAQVTSLENPASIFGNEEVCRKFLNPDITKCIPQGSTFPCTVSDLTNLNVFARNYYLCKDPVDPQLVAHLEARQSGQTANDGVPSPTISSVPNSVRSGAQSQGSGGNAASNTSISFFAWVSGALMLIFRYKNVITL